MRVLLTSSTFPVALDDGIPRFIYDLAEAIGKRVDVTVLAPGAPGAAREEKLGSVDVRRFTYFWPRRLQMLALGQGMRDNLRGSWLARLQVPGFLLRQALSTRALARQRDVDVVNAHWIVPGGLTAAWARGRKRRRFRLVLHVHAGDVFLLQRLPFGRLIARYVIARTDAVLAAGSHVRESLDRLLGYPSGAELRPMGVNIGTFGRDTHAERPLERSVPEESEFPGGFLLFFGRMSEKKGAVYLVRALPRILAVHPDVGLVLIGDGPERTRIEEEVTRLGLEASVRLLGRRPHRDIVRYLHRCLVAVVPSIVDRHGETEGMPTVVLEAMAAGALVVGSAVDGLPDIIRHGENGWLCRPKEPDDLAAKVLLALDNPNAREVIERALATAGRNDWSNVAAEYIRYLEGSSATR